MQITRLSGSRNVQFIRVCPLDNKNNEPENGVFYGRASVLSELRYPARTIPQIVASNSDETVIINENPEEEDYHKTFQNGYVIAQNIVSSS